jgi:hypothetical protein
MACARLGQVLIPFHLRVFSFDREAHQFALHRPFRVRKADQPGCLMPVDDFQDAAGFIHSFFQDPASFHINQGSGFRADPSIQAELLAEEIRLHISRQAYRAQTALMPNSVTIRRARSVAWVRSSAAPVDASPKTKVSAALPPTRIVKRVSNSRCLSRKRSWVGSCMVYPKARPRGTMVTL